LLLDETHDPIQITEVEAFASADVVYGTTPDAGAAIAIGSFLPDTHNKGLHLVSQ